MLRREYEHVGASANAIQREIGEKSPSDSLQSQALQGDDFIYLLLNACVLHPAESRQPCSGRDCDASGLVAGNQELQGTKLEDVPRPHFSLPCHLFFCS